ncbi:hypothetical protein [Shivajiella indica]|uniref:Uncharacterized protein n=1 Tax=Shivajiella indica TaxID=872115 RepID=A0ABW5BC37_9BACT
MKNPKKKNNTKIKIQEEKADWDFSEGFGGIPENVSLTQNIGCGSKPLKNRRK